nr:hypothetical protein CFP56_62931 [Quercus suber]
MVLFHNTFVAMKRQDSRPVRHHALIDNDALAVGHYSDTELFGGRILSGSLQHALRVFKDPGSGVVRIEACPCRGPMKNVPLWTAFVTHYKNDPDHVALETRHVVSFAALRPKPYLFLPWYEPPRNENGQYVLEFISSSGKNISHDLSSSPLAVRSVADNLLLQMHECSWRFGMVFVG